jgi:hypothetical protein
MISLAIPASFKVKTSFAIFSAKSAISSGVLATTLLPTMWSGDSMPILEAVV